VTEPARQPIAPLAAPWFGRWTAIGVVVLTAGYLLQVFSPLRLNHDAVRLLHIAKAAHETGSYLVDGRAEEFPPGYPTVVRLLLTAGLGRTVWLNSFNLLCLGASLIGWYWIGRRQTGLSPATARLVVCLPLLSWVVVKHAVIPLTDLPYLCLSTFALLFLQRYWSETKKPAWCDLSLAVALAFAALQVRTVGLALIAAIAASVLCHPITLRSIPVRLRPSREMVLGCTAIAALILLALTQTDWLSAHFATGYAANLLAFLRGDSPVSPWQVLTYRLHEIASLGLNLSLPGDQRLPFAILGLALVLSILAIARSWWHSHRPWLLYGGFYGGTLLLWPFTDPRFFLPLLPLAGLLIVTAGKIHIAGSPSRQRLAVLGLIFYGLLGLAALSYSTRLSLAGDGFARLYGMPDARASYAHAFGLPPDPNAPPPHERWLNLLREFEPRAAPRRPAPSPSP
jgi:hypothetical protein